MEKEFCIVEIREIYDNLEFKDSVSEEQKIDMLSRMKKYREWHDLEFEDYISDEQSIDDLKREISLEIKELYNELEFKNFISEKERISFFNKLGNAAFKESNFYFALNLYIGSNNREMIRQVGESSLSHGWFHDANRAFEYLGDRKGIFRIIKAIEEKENDVTSYTALESYVGGDTIAKMNKRFQEWATSLGIQYAYSCYITKSLNMAYHLADKYDLGIGIAKGGLFSTYVFSKFGLATKVVQAHKKGKGATFEWVTETSKDEIEGKRVAVFDKDVVSGRTARRVFREIKALKPKTLDLILNHDPCDFGEIGTIIANVPKGFDNVFYPKIFSYDSFDKAVEKLGDYL